MVGPKDWEQLNSSRNLLLNRLRGAWHQYVLKRTIRVVKLIGSPRNDCSSERRGLLVLSIGILELVYFGAGAKLTAPVSPSRTVSRAGGRIGDYYGQV